MKNNIKSARENKSMTQKECADTLGITLRAWQTYEQGVSEPKQDILCKIADMFNVSLDYLLGREPAPNPFAELNLCAEDETAVMEKFMSLPDSFRACALELLRELAGAIKGTASVQSNAQSQSEIYISKTASRNGEPPGEKIITQEELDEIRSRPDADPDM